MKKNENIFEVGHKLGLNKKDINSIISRNEYVNEPLSFIDGPGIYEGSMYGCISIKDVQFCVNLKNKTDIMEEKI